MSAKPILKAWMIFLGDTPTYGPVQPTAQQAVDAYVDSLQKDSNLTRSRIWLGQRRLGASPKQVSIYLTPPEDQEIPF